MYLGEERNRLATLKLSLALRHRNAVPFLILCNLHIFWQWMLFTIWYKEYFGVDSPQMFRHACLHHNFRISYELHSQFRQLSLLICINQVMVNTWFLNGASPLIYQVAALSALSLAFICILYSVKQSPQTSNCNYIAVPHSEEFPPKSSHTCCQSFL